MRHAPQKIRERIKFYSSFDELAIVDKSELPDMFGGNVPLSQFTGKFISRRAPQENLKYSNLLKKSFQMNGRRSFLRVVTIS
jgi:hypothetical protein